MKKLYTLLATVILTASLWAQAPQKFSYQSVIRDASNTLVVNQKVGVAVSILQTSELGNVVFKETHYPTTNSNGLASLAIGTGSKVDGDFSKIDWAKGPYFVKTETDITGGTNYTITTISELLSVPYALFAANSQPGPKGDKGDTGAEGTAGKDGVDGKDGAVGPIGPKGDAGAVGPQGPAGLPGKDGMNGKDGINGADGKDGAVGPIGPKGDTGAVGPQGPAGLPGKDGINGKDGVNGIDGKDGAVGPIGPKGDTGAVGPQGSVGLNGIDGIDGKNGSLGPIGPKGDTGAVGPEGPAGKDGKNGIDGKDGSLGPIGPKGDTGAVGPEGPAGKDGKNGVDGKVEFQNLRVSKTGDTLYLTNGNFVVIPGLSAANAGNTEANTPPTSGYGPNITDVDGNSYKTVYIGTQQWMAENLRVSKYNNGDLIPFIPDSAQWAFRASEAWCYPNNDINNNIPYGKLYNLYTVVDSRKICPVGWHVSTDNEWTILSNYLGGEAIAGGKLKEIGTLHWRSPNPGATDEVNFKAVGGGVREHNGYFYPFKETAYYWTPTLLPNSTTQYYGRRFCYECVGLDRYNNGYPPYTGFSVRCLKDADNTNNQPTQGSIQNIDCGGATNNGTLTANTAASEVSSMLAYTGGNGGTYASQTIASTGVTGLTATLSAGTFANGEGYLTYTITGTPTASGTATFDISIGGKTCTLTRTIVQPTNGFGPNISDIDGNSYKTVYIGTQQWMAENLKTAKYNDGSIIKDWSTDTIGSWCYFENDTNYNNKSGKLYNWYALGKQKICPIGWHVPAENEWQILTEYLGGSSIAGGKLKQTDTLNWAKPNTGATNSTGFNAVPGGVRLNNTFFYWPNNYAYIWSSTEIENDKTHAYFHNLHFDSSIISSEKGIKLAALSVRCLKD